MRNRTLIVVLVMLICLAFAMTAMAAPRQSMPLQSQPQSRRRVSISTRHSPKFWKLPDSTVVATVDGGGVTKGELAKALWYWNAPTVLGDLLTAKMVEQAAKKQGVTLTAADLKAKELDAVKRMNFKTVDELLASSIVSKDRFDIDH